MDKKFNSILRSKKGTDRLKPKPKAKGKDKSTSFDREKNLFKFKTISRKGELKQRVSHELSKNIYHRSNVHTKTFINKYPTNVFQDDVVVS